MKAFHLIKQVYTQAYNKIMANKEQAALYGIVSLIFASCDSAFIFFGLSEHTKPHITHYSAVDWIWLFLKNLVLRFITGIIIVLAYLCLIIPGLYMHTRWAFVSEALIDGNTTMGHALQNSSQLTQNRFFWIKVFMLHTIILLIIPTLLSITLGLSWLVIPNVLFFFNVALSGMGALILTFIISPLLFIFHRHVMLELYYFAKERHENYN